ncbi:MAG: hypothetical protein LC122_13110 [Chitinophagales bacterium]|nr:hypothetical protein [Chitinophagales bacterium]
MEKKDWEKILEVNNKAIQLQTEVSGQYEDIISGLEENEEKINNLDKNIENTSSKFDYFIKSHDDKIKIVSDDVKKIKEDLFILKVLLSSGLLSLIIQIVEMFKK